MIAPQALKERKVTKIKRMTKLNLNNLFLTNKRAEKKKNATPLVAIQRLVKTASSLEEINWFIVVIV